jgi:hypothetical protein
LAALRPTVIYAQLTHHERDNFSFQLTVRAYREQSNRHWHIEAAWPAGAGVEVEDAFFRIEVGHVRVAVEDGGEAAGDRVATRKSILPDSELVRAGPIIDSQSLKPDY